LMEFLLQETTRFVFSTSSIDTWLDLLSNAVGMGAAALCFVPLVTTKIKHQD
jgi:hypothetical protein